MIQVQNHHVYIQVCLTDPYNPLSWQGTNCKNTHPETLINLQLIPFIVLESSPLVMLHKIFYA